MLLKWLLALTCSLSMVSCGDTILVGDDSNRADWERYRELDELAAALEGSWRTCGGRGFVVVTFTSSGRPRVGTFRFECDETCPPTLLPNLEGSYQVSDTDASGILALTMTIVGGVAISARFDAYQERLNVAASPTFLRTSVPQTCSER